MTYTEKLRSPKWQRKRLEILQRDHFTCQLCSDTETELQVHHKQYSPGKEPWDYENELLVTVCRQCHSYVTDNGYPYRVLKKIVDGHPSFLAIDDIGLSCEYMENRIVIGHKTLKELVQLVINYWLMNDQGYNLTDNKIH